MKRRLRLTGIFLLLSTLITSGWFFDTSMANDNESTYYKLDKGLFYLKEVFETISNNYVDNLDPEGLSKSAIEGMLRDFDPYTVFFEDPGSHQMRMITRGKYGGVGMEIGIQDKKITVITPMAGTPAKFAGIRAGDIITGINGKKTEGMNLDEASQNLRGKIGTSVKLEITRPGLSAPLNITLIREEILIKDVTFAHFIEPGTAFIKLSAFSDKAGKELREAIHSLQRQQEIERVILDLRGNPGGLLTAAVEAANVFLPEDQLIVYTRGSHENENKFYTRDTPLLPDQPLVVLVDKSSASASEIVAGAIQDLDRGVLVGEDTFGKGLVQKVYPIDKVTQAYLKITTAKYYIPSGRSIQKEDYKKNNTVFTDLSDSSEYNKKTNYYTSNGRVVHSGGGIKPDVQVKKAELDHFLRNLIARGLFFRYSVDYLSRHPEIKNRAGQNNQLEISEAVLEDFQTFIEAEKLDYEAAGEKELNSFLKIAGREHYSNDVQDLVLVALQKLGSEKLKGFTKNRDQIRYLLEAEFAEKLGGSNDRILNELSNDQQFTKALEVLKNMPEYKDILAVGR